MLVHDLDGVGQLVRIRHRHRPFRVAHSFHFLFDKFQWCDIRFRHFFVFQALVLVNILVCDHRANVLVEISSEKKGRILHRSPNRRRKATNAADK